MEVANYDITCIMPVFNTQKYIEEALLSIINQDGNLKVQIIVIDDESSDNSVNIIKHLQEKYANIELYQQKNSGPALARNFAINKALGKYIMFVDSDDILPSNAIKSLHVEITSNTNEIVMGMFKAFNTKRTWIHESMHYFKDLNTKNTALQELPQLINNMSPWNKIYLRSFIVEHKLHFLENVHLREDIYFVCSALYKAKRIGVISKLVYRYRGREEEGESLTSKVNEKVFEDIYLVSNSLDEVQKNSFYADNKKVQNYRYENEMRAFIYRLWPYVQSANDSFSIFILFQKFLNKVDIEVFSLFDIEKRAVLIKIKKGEFELAKALIKNTCKEVESVKQKIKKKLLDILKKTFWNISNALVSQFLKYQKNSNPIWLIGEQHGNAARDTGYEFFLYCQKNHKNKNIYFVTKKSNLTQEMQKSNTIIYGSLKNYLYALKAEVYIFSDSFKDIFPYYFRIKDLASLKTAVFLQHGISAFKRSEYYLSTQVAQRDERIDLLIVSSQQEKEYVASGLGYDEKNIAVTGMSRFDKLYKYKDTSSTKQILFVPTWRFDLRYANDDIYLKSYFHKKIKELIFDDTLLQLLKKNGFTLHVCFHHAVSKFTHVYATECENIKVSNMDKIDLFEQIIQSNMLITDYSSVAFDMAFIDKPTLFYQFDREDFLCIEGGSFIDFEKDLFGYCSDNPEDIINEIAYNIENNFKIKPKYQNKANSFFAYKDDRNSERIHKMITTLAGSTATQ